MWRAASLMLLALAIPASFPAMSAGTMRQRYGKPIGETFVVRPGILVTATYGPNEETCELLIAPDETGELVKNWSDRDNIPYETLRQVEDELVPTSERGKQKGATFGNVVCGPYNLCSGSQEDFERIVEYANAGKSGARYAVIRWQRSECERRTP